MDIPSYNVCKSREKDFVVQAITGNGANAQFENLDPVPHYLGIIDGKHTYAGNMSIMRQLPFRSINVVANTLAAYYNEQHKGYHVDIYGSTHFPYQELDPLMTIKDFDLILHGPGICSGISKEAQPLTPNEIKALATLLGKKFNILKEQTRQQPTGKILHWNTSNV